MLTIYPNSPLNKVSGQDATSGSIWYEQTQYALGYIPPRYSVPALRSAHRYSIERMRYQREIGFTFKAVFIVPKMMGMK